MTATNMTLARTYEASAWDAADGTFAATYLTGLTDGDLLTNVVQQGTSPDEILKLEFPSLSTLSAMDTVTVEVIQLTSYVTMALLPYDADGTVDTSNKITVTAATGTNTFTLTQVFIDDLFDRGGGKWACRVVEDLAIAGNAAISECGSDITTEGGGGSPGGTPGNAPDNYKYLKNQRLMTNGALARMPRNQREWSNFMHELQKWIKDETGTFDISSADTAKFTGFSTDPTISSIWWHRYGQFVHLEFNIGIGTSDATDFTITGIPEVITPRDPCTYPLFGMHDNGADLAVGSVKIGSDGVITFYVDHDDGAWTGGATGKGFAASIGAKGLIYDLRNPPKQ